MVDLAGQQIGNYHLAERIASGGMADVYLARHTYLDRRVAVKILHSGISEAGQMLFYEKPVLSRSSNIPTSFLSTTLALPRSPALTKQCVLCQEVIP